MKETVPAYRRHDISDETWTLLEPHLPGRRGVWGLTSVGFFMVLLRT